MNQPSALNPLRGFDGVKSNAKDDYALTRMGQFCNYLCKLPLFFEIIWNLVLWLKINFSHNLNNFEYTWFKKSERKNLLIFKKCNPLTTLNVYFSRATSPFIVHRPISQTNQILTIISHLHQSYLNLFPQRWRIMVEVMPLSMAFNCRNYSHYSSMTHPLWHWSSRPPFITYIILSSSKVDSITFHYLNCFISITQPLIYYSHPSESLGLSCNW